MSKIEFQIPEKFIYSTKLSVREIDIAKGLHVSFATILDYVFEAHILFFKNLGFSVTDIEGNSLIFGNLSIIYQGEVLYGDFLEIEVTVDNFKEKACDEYFRITKNQGKDKVAIVKIFMLFFDYAARKTIPIPKSFLSKVQESMNGQLPSKQIDHYPNVLPIWKLAHKFTIDIYNFTKKFPDEEKDNLSLKIRKLAVALPLYINETESKKGDSEVLKYFKKTLSVIEELKYYLVLSNDLRFSDANFVIQELETLKKELKSYYQENWKREV
jgi:four helix bundle protein